MAKETIYTQTAQLLESILCLVALNEIPMVEIDSGNIKAILENPRIARHLEYIDEDSNDAAITNFGVNLLYHDN